MSFLPLRNEFNLILFKYYFFLINIFTKRVKTIIILYYYNTRINFDFPITFLSNQLILLNITHCMVYLQLIKLQYLIFLFLF